MLQEVHPLLSDLGLGLLRRLAIAKTPLTNRPLGRIECLNPLRMGVGKEKIKVFDKDKIPEQDDSLIIDMYIEKIQMPICSYVLFIVFSVFAIGLLIFLWMNVRQYGNQDIFIITSIFVGIMTVLIVAFALINLVFSEESRKYALLTYAYDEALKKVGERYDKKTIATSRNDNTESKKEEIEYGVRTITKTFESYCQNITAK